MKINTFRNIFRSVEYLLEENLDLQEYGSEKEEADEALVLVRTNNFLYFDKILTLFVFKGIATFNVYICKGTATEYSMTRKF